MANMSARGKKRTLKKPVHGYYRKANWVRPHKRTVRR
jgi:hypothetical protein